MKTVLIILCGSFICYTLAVYAWSDPRAAVPAPDDAVLAGWKTWQDKNCQSCHQLYGLGGYAGPDLTNTASLKGAVYMKAIIQHGTATMPNFQLKPAEVDAIVAFLGWVDQSGTSRVPDSAVHWTGSYIIK